MSQASAELWMLQDYSEGPVSKTIHITGISEKYSMR
jgi:hypothetical protein